MATKIGLYNIALRSIGTSPIESLTEELQARRYLDAVYDLSLDTCLRMGMWNFAMATVSLTPDVALPAFYYRFSYTKPADWVRTRDISALETLDWPLTDFQDQAGAWLTNVNPLYVRFVSKDQALGLNLDIFPPDYAEFAGAYLGSRIFRQATGHSLAELDAYNKVVLDPAMQTALANDALDGPPEDRLPGSWVQARVGRARFVTVRGGNLNIS